MTPKIHGLVELIAKKDVSLGLILKEIISEFEKETDLIIAQAKSLSAVDQTQDRAKRRILTLDSLNIIRLAPEASASGDYHIAIPDVENPPPATGNRTNDGLILIDKTAADLCYYTNKARYRLNGVAF